MRAQIKTGNDQKPKTREKSEKGSKKSTKEKIGPVREPNPLDE